MRIAILFGGVSHERDVSMATAGQVFRALRERDHDVLAFDTATGRLKPQEEDQLVDTSVALDPPAMRDIPTTDLTSQLASSGELHEVDVVFLALHGGAGEDGTVQALLDVAGVCYTGSGHLASAIAMDKEVSKKLFRWSNVPTPDWIMGPTDHATVGAQLGYPVVVKPNKAGSTIGLSVVRDPAKLEAALQEALQYDERVMIERFIPGREFVVGVLDKAPLAVGEIVPRYSEIFDYRSKYQVNGAFETFPADTPAATTTELQSTAVMAHNALRLGSYSRVDFRMESGGKIWCLEANTLPGMTATSLLPQSANAVGISFPELCERICLLALRRA